VQLEALRRDTRKGGRGGGGDDDADDDGEGRGDGGKREGAGGDAMQVHPFESEHPIASYSITQYLQRAMHEATTSSISQHSRTSLGQVREIKLELSRIVNTINAQVAKIVVAKSEVPLTHYHRLYSLTTVTL
jgi:hypothetical protein